MAFDFIKQDRGYAEIVVNTETDKDDIPVYSLKPGSNVFVISTSTVYMLNTDKEWVEI